MKYSLLKEDDKAFHLMHPSGDTFQVAKKGIDEKLHEKIRNMVPQYMNEGGKVLPASSVVQTANDSAMAPLGGEENANPVANPYDGSTVLNETSDAYSLQDPSGKVVNVNKSGLGPAQIAQINSLNESPVAPKPSIATDQSAGTPSLTKKASDTGSTTIPLPHPNLPDLPQRTPQDPFALEERGVREQAKAEKDLGQASATAYQQRQNQLADAKAVFDSHMAQLNQRDADLSRAYENGHIDPTRVISNMSTGNKIMAGIGLILGGLGGGALGTGQNDALKTLNNIVDRDIDAQKAELDKGKNLLSQNFERTHNLEQAHLMIKNDILGALEVNIKQLMSKASSPMAQGKADMLLGQIAQQRQQNNMAMAEKMLPVMLTGGAATNGINPEILPEKLRERSVRLPGGGLGLATTKEDAKDIKETLSSLDNIDNQVDNAIKFMETTGRTIGAGFDLPHWAGGAHLGLRTAADAKSDSMRRSIVLELNQLHGLKRLTDTEFNQFEQMVPPPGAWNQDKALAMLMQLRSFIANKRTTTLQNRVSNYQEPNIPSQKKGFVSNVSR